MNTRYKYVKKFAIYISAIFCFSVVAALVHAQPRMPTQKDIDELNALAKKLPTREQSAALSKIADDYQKKYVPLHNEFEKLGKEIARVTMAPGFLLTKAHIQAAMINHKKLRSLYLEHFRAIAAWGHRSGRENCVRQAEKMSPYTMQVSEKWLAEVAALSLATAQDRIYASLYVAGGGGGETFEPDSGPPGDNRHWVGTELIGLYSVCGGGRGEYVPGIK